jgi:signal transduction histidine kinase
MNFFWKVFFSTILISAITFSVGSFLLIDFQFRSTLNREITAAYEENDILRFAMNKELETINDRLLYKYDTDSADKLKAVRNQLILQVAQSATINTSKGTIPFRLNDSAYHMVFDSINMDVDNSILKQLSDRQTGYEIVKSDSHYYIHTAGPVTIQVETLYLENFRDITFLFESRKDQYQTFYYLMFAMVAISGLVVFVVSRWLTGPLKKLSRATKQIANGKFDQRVSIQSRDEIGKLSKDFNKMAVKLEQMVEELREASRRQEDFVDSFAHELKTPLTSIIGYADMLRSKKMDPEQVILSANYIFEEGKRLESLSMKLMDMIILKNQQFSMKHIHARDFFASIQGAMLPLFEKENISFSVRAEDAILLMEPDLMKTVFLNLLDNSRKAMDRGGYIALLGKWDADHYIIIVADNGKGMEESELSKITEAFYMVDKSRARAQGGAGLGLAICSEILKLHVAAMEFQSVPGEGTTVTIQLKGAEKI